MGTPAPVPRLRGRETEQRVLGEALDRVASGSLAILLIEGEAGIGKTRLLKEGLADAADPGRARSMAWGRSVMKRIRIERRRVRSERPWLEVLPPDPRVPDIVRAKALARTAGSKEAAGQ